MVIKSWEKDGIKVSETKPVIAELSEKFKALDILHYCMVMNLADEEDWCVYYQDVSDAEKIPGLVSYIESEKRRICGWLEEIGFSGIKPCSFRVCLSPYKKTRVYSKKVSSSDIDRLVDFYESAGVYAVPTKQLREANTDTIYRDTVTGEFEIQGQVPVITIYYRVLDARSTQSYMAQVSAVLAHEMFHYAHHYYAMEGFFEQSLYGERVKEALADFFGVTYCLERANETPGGNMAEELMEYAGKRFRKWKERRDSIWPYAYALYCMQTEKRELPLYVDAPMYKEFGCYQKMRNIVEISRLSMEEAYGQLVGKPAEETEENPEFCKAVKKKNVFPNHTPGPGTLQLITMTPGKAYSMTENQRYKAFHPETGHRAKEQMGIVYIKDILMKNQDMLMNTGRIMKILQDPWYDLELGETTVRALLETLALYEKDIYRIQEGRNYLYLYSKEKPAGYVTEDDFE